MSSFEDFLAHLISERQEKSREKSQDKSQDTSQGKSLAYAGRVGQAGGDAALKASRESQVVAPEAAPSDAAPSGAQIQGANKTKTTAQTSANNNAVCGALKSAVDVEARKSAVDLISAGEALKSAVDQGAGASETSVGEALKSDVVCVVQGAGATGEALRSAAKRCEALLFSRRPGRTRRPGRSRRLGQARSAQTLGLKAELLPRQLRRPQTLTRTFSPNLSKLGKKWPSKFRKKPIVQALRYVNQAFTVD